MANKPKNQEYKRRYQSLFFDESDPRAKPVAWGSCKTLKGCYRGAFWRVAAEDRDHVLIIDRQTETVLHTIIRDERGTRMLYGSVPHQLRLVHNKRHAA